MTQMEINKIAKSIVRMLIEDDTFINKIAKSMPKKERMLSTKQAAELLGISKWTVRKISTQLGAIKSGAKGDFEGIKRYGHLAFPENGLIERYEEYLRTK